MFTTDKPFRATVHQHNRRSFGKPPLPNDRTETKSLKTDTMENKAMIAVIILAEKSEHKFTLGQVMDHRVTDECLSIFNINGSIRKGQKSKLIDKLNMQVISLIPQTYICDRHVIFVAFNMSIIRRS